MQRIVAHIDMDAFFVSVEELFDPSLKGKPVVVGGKANERGVVSAASYAARKYGVHSAMPLRRAYQLCPHAIFVEGHMSRYRDCSQMVYAVLQKFSPKVEMASIDEAYLDLTGTERLHGPTLKATHELHEAVRRETRLNCSIGVSSSRMVSKVASDQAKPNGVLWIPVGQEAAFLGPLDVRKIPGVGKRTEQVLHEMGIRRVRDLAALDAGFLESRLGKWGLALAGKSLGLDAGGYFDHDVGSEEDPKSISHEHTFGEDSTDADHLEATLAKLSELVCRRLREHGMHARTMHIKLRYSDFSTYTRAVTFDQPTDLDIDLVEHSRMLFRRNWNGTAVRLLGVAATGLSSHEGQLNLLDSEKTVRWRNALTAADKLRDKFGDSSVKLGSGMKGSYREKTHENPADLFGRKKRPKPET
ncbi:MAG TPA: DNA polymerase IV [Bryobacteraceae bacterium]|nr:DNA polymerase IV [Bryobacteraceae bacterium]